MSDRVIDLGNTGAAASRLLRPRQATQPAPAATEPVTPPLSAVEAAPAATEAPAAAPSRSRSPRTPKKTTAPASSQAKAPAERVGGFIPKELRDRAVAAHQATLYMEGETTWADFLVKAITAETERREQQYNDGEPFEQRSGGKLKTGRPLRSS